MTPGSSCRRRRPRTTGPSSRPSRTSRPGGSTNLEAGLRLGYGLARETLTEDGIDRIVLASDGVANVGLTDADGILRQIRDDAAAGIELVSVGVGMGNYNDTLLEQLADQGDGFYAYVNDLTEARRLFTEDLTSTLQTVALDAKVQVEFDPDVVRTYRLIGYENRAMADRDFRDPNVDAGAIGAGHAVTALYAIGLRDGFSRDDRLGPGPPALDGARGVARIVPHARDRHRRPRDTLRRGGSDPSARRHRGGHRSRPARRRRAAAATCATSSRSPARTTVCPRPTRPTTSSTSSSA